MNDDKLLHIYGQDTWHDDVHIVGTEEALKELRDTIDEALCGVPHTMDAFVNDGEEYGIKIICMEGYWGTMAWRRLAVPYTADCAKEIHVDTLWPWDIKEEE